MCAQSNYWVVEIAYNSHVRDTVKVMHHKLCVTVFVAASSWHQDTCRCRRQWPWLIIFTFWQTVKYQRTRCMSGEMCISHVKSNAWNLYFFITLNLLENSVFGKQCIMQNVLLSNCRRVWSNVRKKGDVGRTIHEIGIVVGPSWIFRHAIHDSGNADIWVSVWEKKWFRQARCREIGNICVMLSCHRFYLFGFVCCIK